MKKYIIIAICFILIFINAYSQYVNDDTVMSYNYYRLSDSEYINVWTIANYDKILSISDIYTDSKNRIYFAYHDRLLSKPIFVTGTGKSFKKIVIDDKSFRGNSIALGVDVNSFEAHVAYINERSKSLEYANNLNFKFQNYEVDNLTSRGFHDINVVVSAFREPVIFFLNNSNHLYLSRYYKGSFFTESVYTNTTLKSAVPFLRDNRYSIFLQSLDNGNIFYASRETNTAFRFYNNRPLITNASDYSIYFENSRNFVIAYNTIDSPNTINEYHYLSGEIKKSTILDTESSIQKFAFDYRLDTGGTSILYQNESGILTFYNNGLSTDLSILGATEGSIKLKSISHNLYVFIYQSAITKELKLALLNTENIKIRSLR